jgi:hypothetical protein
MTDPDRLEATRQAIGEYLRTRFPDQVIDEYGEGAATWPEERELLPFWLAVAPEPVRVYVSRAALEHLAPRLERPETIVEWLDAQDLAGKASRGRDVVITSGGVGVSFDME